ncbi:hypothetical protein LY474_30370 [Myxococcus stipitatus]|uniref:hypothetical protein n=1 Tax=Myxococcus stipitatus TaxID=83455 RepID=UPI001F32BFCF|nr:hypothetical protein [Myxococcus stipitatus]MCE9672120.1 hypothetical protein [Myxococcus stipitatus]
MSSPEVRCPRDPANVADAPCSRCGTFTCLTCAVLQEGRRLCQECVSRLRRVEGSWLAVWAGGLGFLSLGCVPLAPVAIVLAGIDFAKTRLDGERDRKALKLDALAIALGVVAIAWWVYYFTSPLSASLEGES